MLIKGKTGLITGGASGLGEATAELLVGAGANVVIVDMNEERGRAVAARLGPGALFAKADVADEAGIEQAVALAVDTFGALHIAANIAGITIPRRVVGKKGPYPLADFKKVIEVNLVGSFNVLRLAAAAMAQNRPDENGERGVVVNTSSVASFHGQPGQAAYSASKGAINSLSLCVARDLAEFGIRVMAIAPGLFETPIYATISPEVRNGLMKDTVFPNRFGMPKEFAMAVRHIVENPMFNGDVVRLDGAVRF